MKLKIIAVFALLALLAGCAGNYSRDYQEYSQRVSEQNAQRLTAQQALEAQRAEQIRALSNTASGCVDDACRTQVAALTAVVLAGGGGVGQSLAPSQGIQAPTPTQHPIWGTLQSAIGTVFPIAGAAFQSHNNRRIVESQNQTVSSIVGVQAQASVDTALGIAGELGGALGAGIGIPTTVNNTTIGGDYLTVGGDQLTGNTTVGGDQIGGDFDGGGNSSQLVGGDYLTIGRDQTTIGGHNAGGNVDASQVGGDVINNSGRYISPGPIDQSQTVLPPDPVPVDPGAGFEVPPGPLPGR